MELNYAGFPTVVGCGLGAMHPKSARVNPARGAPELCEGKVSTETFGLKKQEVRGKGMWSEFVGN